MFSLHYSPTSLCSIFYICCQNTIGESMSLWQHVHTGHHYRHGSFESYFCFLPYQGAAKTVLCLHKQGKVRAWDRLTHKTDKLLTKVKHRGRMCYVSHVKGHTITRTHNLYACLNKYTFSQINAYSDPETHSETASEQKEKKYVDIFLILSANCDTVYNNTDYLRSWALNHPLVFMLLLSEEGSK